MKIRCSICEGLIVGGRCRECGMYHRPSKGKYYLNECRHDEVLHNVNQYEKREKSYTVNECDHDEKEHNLNTYSRTIDKNQSKERRTEWEKKKTTTSKWGDARREKRQGKAWISLMITGVLLLIGFLADQDDHSTYEDDYIYEVEEEPVELSREGEEFSVTLEAGTYMVGWQIPEGYYSVNAQNPHMSIQMDDDVNGEYDYWVMEDYEKDGRYCLEDIPLSQGAVLNIQGSGSMDFETDCGQTDSMESFIKNPLTDTITVDEKELIAGEDFPSGWYDLAAVNDYASVIVERETGEEEYYFVDTEGDYDGEVYRNICLYKGDRIKEEIEGKKVELVPSEWIYNNIE